MKRTEKNKINKRKYNKPLIVDIKLDKEISVFMVSPPGDPTFSSTGSGNSENFNTDPYKFTKS